VGIFEIMIVSDTIRDQIMDQAPNSEVRATARKEGMRSLRESGLLAIYDGSTSVEEVLRETMMSV
jgi:type IV pilus assembly protein PilB